MKARNGILALLAVLALAGCSGDAAPTEPGAGPRQSVGNIITIGSGNYTATTNADTTAMARGITLGSGA